MREQHKKESPILSLLGMGGGGTGTALSGGIADLVGEQLFETAGTFTWNAPAGAAANGISIVVIGGGGGGTLYPSGTIGGSGGGGARLSYINNQSVSLGQELTITVGAPGRGGHNAPATPSSTLPYSIYGSNVGQDGGFSSVRNPGQPTTNSDSIIYAGGGGGSGGSSGGSGGSTQWNSHGGGNGGNGGSQGGNTHWWCFGGGTGGYGFPSANGTGGNGGRYENGNPKENGASAGAPNSGAAGGAAGWAVRTGVGVFGKGPTGAINSPGSGGTSSKYGGGGGTAGSSGASTPLSGQVGAVRIIWGPGRQFPDTGTGLDGGPAPS